MRLPSVEEIPTSRELTDVFLGYNHNLRIGEGEFYDMKNLTGDDYPVLSPRGKRGVYVAEDKVRTGLIEKDALCYTEGKNFVINGEEIDLGLITEYDEDGKLKAKKLVSMGAYVIILPDKKYVNIKDMDNDNGDIEHHFLARTPLGDKVMVSYTPCLYDGGNMTIEKQAVAPTITEEMVKNNTIPYWLDISESPATLKVYSTSTESWSAVATTYVKISAIDIDRGFNVGDTVSISGSMFENLNVSSTIVSKSEHSIVVGGFIEEGTNNALVQETPIVVSRWMPILDYICESQNRLWGCRYGVAYQGKMLAKNDDGQFYMADKLSTVVNEIYCCKLGDFKNWQTYQGVASDAYAVSLGTDGHFTGAVTHLGYPIFFKENYMHKVYGSYPSNYKVQTTACRGVQTGCDRSIAIVNEVVYYKSRSGIMAYDGSLPTEISGALGDKSYSDARAGYLGNKYYVSMRDDEDAAEAFRLFVFDTKRGLWYKEDDTEAFAFCNCRGDLYFIDYDSRQIRSVKGSGVVDKDVKIDWEAVTGYIGTDSPDKKYISRLDVRMKLDVGSKVSFYAEYDSSGNYEHLFNMTGVDLKSFAVPIKPKRCDHMRLKIVGEGEAKIFSICKTVEWGSDN